MREVWKASITPDQARATVQDAGRGHETSHLRCVERVTRTKVQRTSRSLTNLLSLLVAAFTWKMRKLQNAAALPPFYPLYQQIGRPAEDQAASDDWAKFEKEVDGVYRRVHSEARRKWIAAAMPPFDLQN